MSEQTITEVSSIDGAASALDDGLERMFRVTKFDHPDLVGGIVWADCELVWINERITLAILAEREQCATTCENLRVTHGNGDPDGDECAAAIRMRSNAPHEGPGGFSPGPLDAVVGRRR